jgi:hypothetical protein
MTTKQSHESRLALLEMILQKIREPCFVMGAKPNDGEQSVGGAEHVIV